MIVQYVNKRNYINFNSKKVPNSVTRIIDSEIQNESALIDARIKEFLQNLIDKNTPMSQRNMATQLGLSWSIFRHGE